MNGWRNALTRYKYVLWLVVLIVLLGLSASTAFASKSTGGSTERAAPNGNGVPAGASSNSAPQIDDAFLTLVPGAAGNCPAPANGGTTDVGCRFVLELWVNSGTNLDLTAQQTYMNFSSSLIQNARVSSIGISCVPTSTVTGDLSTFDAVLQNEVCNGPANCQFRSNNVPPGSLAFASGALNNCPGGCGGLFRLAEIGICAVAGGQAHLRWEFWPPAPQIRDTQIVNSASELVHNRALFVDYTFNINSPEGTLTPTTTSTPTATQTHTITPTPGSPTSTPGCGLAWNVVNSPNMGGAPNVLQKVDAVSPDDVWAVGHFYSSDTGSTRTLIEHWDGTQWSVVPSPNVGVGNNRLDDVEAIAANDVWAVGGYVGGPFGLYRTLTLHWNGVAWSVVPSPNPTTGFNILRSVSAASSNDVWAVGYACSGDCEGGNGTAAQTLTLHWNGSAWNIVPSPNFGAYTSMLWGVTVVSANDVWAVGRSAPCAGCVASTLFLHWNGASWSVVPSPNLGPSTNELYDILAISANDIWAVGNYTPATGPAQTLTFHYDGVAWNPIPSPTGGGGFNSSHLWGVAATAANDVWAVGNRSSGGTTLTFILHWNGAQWVEVPSPSLSGPGPNLLGVTSVDATDVWAVGYTGNQTLVERYHDPCPPSTSTSTATSTVVPPTDTNTPAPTDTPTFAPTFTPTNTPVPPTSTHTPAPGCSVCNINVFNVTISCNPDGTVHWVATVRNQADCAAAVPYKSQLQLKFQGSSGWMGVRTDRRVTTIPPNTTMEISGDFCYEFSPDTNRMRIEFALDSAERSCNPRRKSTSIEPCTPNPTCAMIFSDVGVEHVSYNYIAALNSEGVLSGYAGGTFRPDAAVTRGQLAKIVVVAFRIQPVAPDSAHFSDVTTDNPFFAYVETALARGLVSGYGDGTFRPYGNVTRGQIAKVVVQASGWKPVNPATPTFHDVPVNSTFYGYVETAHAHGILSGYSDGSFRPTNTATRSQMSKIVSLPLTIQE